MSGHGDHLVHPQFHSLLNNGLHFVCLGQALEQIDPGGQFRPLFFDKAQFAADLVLLKRRDMAAVFPAVHTVADGQFLPHPHAQYILDMVHVSAPDQNLFIPDLVRFHKKLIHGSLPMHEIFGADCFRNVPPRVSGRSRKPILPDMSLPIW